MPSPSRAARFTASVEPSSQTQRLTSTTVSADALRAFAGSARHATCPEAFAAGKSARCRLFAPGMSGELSWKKASGGAAGADLVYLVGASLTEH